MSNSVNPLRILAESQYGVKGGTENLVANGIYSVDDIVRPILSQSGPAGDPRIFFSYGQRRSRLQWRKVNKDGWISPKLKASGDKDTVIQIRFARPKRFNRLDFELLRVPQQWTVKYYDHTRKRMVALTDGEGRKVDGSLSGFRNNVLTPRHEKNNSHKWRGYDYDLPIIRTNLIEIHLNREVKNPPIQNLEDFFGLPRNTPYSLGIRNLRIKLRISEDDDGGDDDDDGTPTPIGTTERPVVTRYTSVNAHDDDPNTYWECGPQGAANSVVPLYLDMRQDDGSASIFDRIKLTPLWTGPNMSVYWSNDDVTTPWKVSPNRSKLIREGDADFTEDVGLTVDATDDAWSIPNDYMKLDLNKSFTVGLLFTPTDTDGATTDAGNRYLWTFERPGSAVSLRFNPGSTGAGSMTGEFEVVGLDGSVLFATTTGYTLDVDTQYGVVAGYTADALDPTSEKGWHFAIAEQPAADADITEEKDDANVLSGFYPTGMTVGSNVALDRPMLGSVSRLWVRMDPWSSAAARSYLKGPGVFTNGDGDKGQRVNGHYGAVLIAKLVKDVSVRIGPGAGFYRNKEWTPVPIDYPLQATQYQLPLINAKFLKLEFTKLQPRLYMTEEEVLPVTSFPKHVVDWFRGGWKVNNKGVHTLAGSRELFEIVPFIRTPGDRRKMPDVRGDLESGGGNVPPTIYHNDMSTTDMATNPRNFDGSNRYRELEFATEPMRFFRKGRHEYDTQYIEVEHRAFFVGIKDLQVFRADHTVQFDSREYNETYDDDANIEDTTGWINVGGVMRAQDSGAELVSSEFQSFSNFETIQMAVLDGGWESGFTTAQIDLGTITHLVDPGGNAFNGSHVATTSTFSVVTGQYQGARGGNVLQVTRTPGSTEAYGLLTDAGTYQDTLTEDGGARTSAVVRVQLPATNKGTYELRLYAGGDLVASKPIVVPVKAWREVEVAYNSRVGDTDWQVAVVQTDPRITEPIVVDMMGVWQNPIRWEVTNQSGFEVLGIPQGPDPGDLGPEQGQELPLRADDIDVSGQEFAVDEPFSEGSPTEVDYEWYPLLWPLNDPRAYFRFPNKGHRLRVRATALRDGAAVSAWSVVPWYIESSMVMRAPIDYNPPWGVSDQQDLLDTTRKPMFKTWHRFFPQRFSTNLYGW